MTFGSKLKFPWPISSKGESRESRMPSPSLGVGKTPHFNGKSHVPFVRVKEYPLQAFKNMVKFPLEFKNIPSPSRNILSLSREEIFFLPSLKVVNVSSIHSVQSESNLSTQEKKGQGWRPCLHHEKSQNVVLLDCLFSKSSLGTSCFTGTGT